MKDKILDGRSIGLCFLCENPLNYPPVSVPRSGDPLPTVTGIGSNGFRFGPDDLGEEDLDTPIYIYEKRLTKMLSYGFLIKLEVVSEYYNHSRKYSLHTTRS